MPKASAKVKLLRLEAALSANKLARKADLDRTTVSNAENGREISELTLAKLAKTLSEALGKEVAFDDLLADEKPGKR